MINGRAAEITQKKRWVEEARGANPVAQRSGVKKRSILAKQARPKRVNRALGKGTP
jgi:hypothetical protein